MSSQLDNGERTEESFESNSPSYERNLPTHSQVGTITTSSDDPRSSKVLAHQIFSIPSVVDSQTGPQRTEDNLQMEEEEDAGYFNEDSEDSETEERFLTPKASKSQMSDSNQPSLISLPGYATPKPPNKKAANEPEYSVISSNTRISSSNLHKGASSKSLLKMSIINQSRESLMRAESQKMITRSADTTLQKMTPESKKDAFAQNRSQSEASADSFFNTSQVMDDMSKFGTIKDTAGQSERPSILDSDKQSIIDNLVSGSESSEKPGSPSQKSTLQKMNTELQIYTQKENWQQIDVPQTSSRSDSNDSISDRFAVTNDGSIHDLSSIKTNLMTGLLGSNPLLLKSMSKTKDESDAYEKTKKVILAKIQANRKAKNMENLAKQYHNMPPLKSSLTSAALLDPKVDLKLRSVADKYNATIRSTRTKSFYQEASTSFNRNASGTSSEDSLPSKNSDENSSAKSADGLDDFGMKRNASSDVTSIISGSDPASPIIANFNNFFKPSNLAHQIDASSQDMSVTEANSNSASEASLQTSAPQGQTNVHSNNPVLQAASNDSINDPKSEGVDVKSDIINNSTGNPPTNRSSTVGVDVTLSIQTSNIERKKSVNSSASGSGNELMRSTGSINSLALLDWGTGKQRNAKRFKWATMEKILLKAQDPGQMEIRDRRRNLKVIVRCFTGSNFVDWLLRECNFYSKEEAIRYAQAFFHEGYIVPVDVEETNEFTGDKTLFRFQTPSLFPLSFRPTDREYLIFLLVKHAIRSKKRKEKTLNEYEQFHLDNLKSKLDRDWKYIEEAVEERLKKLNAMSKNDSKLLMSYADGYWAVQRPSPKRKEIMILRDKALGKMNQDDENGGEDTSNEQLASPGGPKLMSQTRLTPQEEYVHILNKLEKLQISLHMNRIRPSAAAASVIQRCQAYLVNDPMLNPNKFNNPFITNDLEGWDYNRLTMEPTVTAHDIAIWSISIKDLLWDAKGRKFFKEFLMKEFCGENLLFYEAYLDLMELTSNRAEFIGQAKVIYEQFLAPKSPFELNLESKFRESLMRRFHRMLEASKTHANHGGKTILPPSSNGQKTQIKPLDEELFDDVKRIVVSLMNKNNYQRFIQSLGGSPSLNPLVSHPTSNSGGILFGEKGILNRRISSKPSH